MSYNSHKSHMLQNHALSINYIIGPYCVKRDLEGLGIFGGGVETVGGVWKQVPDQCREEKVNKSRGPVSRPDIRNTGKEENNYPPPGSITLIHILRTHWPEQKKAKISDFVAST